MTTNTFAIVGTEKKLAETLTNNLDTIEIEGDLQRKIIKIKATGAVAW